MRQRATVGDMRARALQIIEERQGRLLSEQLTSAKDKIRMVCAQGHVFETNYDRLSQGNWCRKCGAAESARKRLGYTVKDMQHIAAERGGQFRSQTFNGVKEKHEWWCPKHGSFWAPPDSIVNTGAWCPDCWNKRRGKDIRRPIDDVLGYINQRGGELVSPIGDYETLSSRVRVRCADGHEWDVTAAQLVSANSWCPECASTAGETITRRIFEMTYCVPFPKCRPSFLRTDKGGYLELDGYSADLALAFEYQGPYHDRADQIERDHEKRRRCEVLGIMLLEVPYVKNPYPPEKVLEVVTKVIKAVDPDRMVVLPDEDFFPQKLRKLQELARSRGGCLFSDQYLGAKKKLVWKCGDPSHPPWEATPEQMISKGTWCPYCAGIAGKDLDWLREFAAEHGLTLLADKYFGANEKYTWRCGGGHKFESHKPTIIQRIRKGYDACPMCAGTAHHFPVEIDDLMKAAEQRGGTCMATHYTNAHTPVRWRCSNGHQFQRIWNKVQQGRWCTVDGCPDNRDWGRYDRFEI